MVQFLPVVELEDCSKTFLPRLFEPRHVSSFVNSETTTGGFLSYLPAQAHTAAFLGSTACGDSCRWLVPEAGVCASVQPALQYLTEDSTLKFRMCVFGSLLDPGVVLAAQAARILELCAAFPTPSPRIANVYYSNAADDDSVLTILPRLVRDIAPFLQGAKITVERLRLEDAVALATEFNAHLCPDQISVVPSMRQAGRYQLRFLVTAAAPAGASLRALLLPPSTAMSGNTRDALAALLSGATQITQVVLPLARATDDSDGASKISLTRPIVTFAQLQTLKLDGMPLSSSEAEDIAAALTSLSQLRALNLSKCKLAPESLCSIVRALHCQHELTSLRIADNDNQCAAAYAFEAVASCLRSLRTLDVSFCFFGAAGTLALASALPKCKLLGSVVLGGNIDRTDTDAAPANLLPRVLEALSPLDLVDLGVDDYIGHLHTSVLPAVAPAICAFTSLVQVTLSNNLLLGKASPCAAARHFHDFITQILALPCLESLHLDSIGLTLPAVRALVSSLMAAVSLVDLVIFNNALNDACLRLLLPWGNGLPRRVLKHACEGNCFSMSLAGRYSSLMASARSVATFCDDQRRRRRLTGLKLAADGLQECHATTLIIDRHFFWLREMRVLAPKLKTMECLASLHLTNCKINALAAAELLQHLPPLRSLYLSGNPLSCRGVVLVLDALLDKAVGFVRGLTMRDCDIGDGGAAAIADFLTSDHAPSTELTFDDNKRTSEDGWALIIAANAADY